MAIVVLALLFLGMPLLTWGSYQGGILHRDARCTFANTNPTSILCVQTMPNNTIMIRHNTDVFLASGSFAGNSSNNRSEENFLISPDGKKFAVLIINKGKKFLISDNKVIRPFDPRIDTLLFTDTNHLVGILHGQPGEDSEIFFDQQSVGFIPGKSNFKRGTYFREGGNYEMISKLFGPRFVIENTDGTQSLFSGTQILGTYPKIESSYSHFDRNSVTSIYPSYSMQENTNPVIFFQGNFFSGFEYVYHATPILDGKIFVIYAKDLSGRDFIQYDDTIVFLPDTIQSRNKSWIDADQSFIYFFASDKQYPDTLSLFRLNMTTQAITKIGDNYAHIKPISTATQKNGYMMNFLACTRRDTCIIIDANGNKKQTIGSLTIDSYCFVSPDAHHTMYTIGSGHALVINNVLYPYRLNIDAHNYTNFFSSLSGIAKIPLQGNTQWLLYGPANTSIYARICMLGGKDCDTYHDLGWDDFIVSSRPDVIETLRARGYILPQFAIDRIDRFHVAYTDPIQRNTIINILTTMKSINILTTMKSQQPYADIKDGIKNMIIHELLIRFEEENDSYVVVK